MAQIVNVDNLEEHGFSAREVEDMRATVRHLKEKGNLPPASEIATEFINTQCCPLQNEGMTVESIGSMVLEVSTSRATGRKRRRQRRENRNEMEES